MHKDFADWYRLVDLEPKGETLEKRWQAIEQFCESEAVRKLMSNKSIS